MERFLTLAFLWLLGLHHSNSAACFLDNNERTLSSELGLIESPRYGRQRYPNNQWCKWVISVPISKAVLLEVNDFDTGFASGKCNDDYVILPHGQRLCGRSVPKTCFVYLPQYNSNCMGRLPQCGWNMNIYSLTKWPPTIIFVANQQKNFRGFSMNYTMVDCKAGSLVMPPPPDSSNESQVNVNKTEEPGVSQQARQALDLARRHFTSLTVTAFLCAALFMVTILFGAKFIEARKRNKHLEKMMMTSSTPGRSFRPPLAPENGYVDARPDDVSSVTYEYIQPEAASKCEQGRGSNQYELPIPLVTPAYVDMQTLVE